MRRILVTGASGFVGKFLIEELAKGNVVVTAIARRVPEQPNPKIEWLEGDLLDERFVQQIFVDESYDVLLHLAWETRHGYFWNAPENLEWVRASLLLLSLFSQSGGRRFVGVGTAAEYSSESVQVCRPGVTATRPDTLYGVAKNSFHRLAESYSRNQGLSYGWGRVFSLIGTGDAPGRLIPSAISSLMIDQTFVCNHPHVIRDFMDVRDCAAALAVLAFSDVNGAVNVCSGVPVSLGELLEVVAMKLGKYDMLEVRNNLSSPSQPAVWGVPFWQENDVEFVPKNSMAASIDWVITRTISESESSK